jgi:hypothetical protein
MNPLERTSLTIAVLDEALDHLINVEPRDRPRDTGYQSGHAQGYRDAMRVLEARRELFKVALDVANHLVEENEAHGDKA